MDRRLSLALGFGGLAGLAAIAARSWREKVLAHLKVEFPIFLFVEK